MPSTTRPELTVKNTKVKPSKFFGYDSKEAWTGQIGKQVNANKKAIKINARKISTSVASANYGNEGWRSEHLKKFHGEKDASGGELKGILGEIAGAMDGIRQTLIDQNKLDTKSLSDSKKDDEKKKRSLGESALEATKNALQSAGEKMLAPVKNIFGKIFDFIKVMFLGRVAMKLWDWFADPANAEKIKSIFKFLKDWWPVIVAGIMAIVGPGVTFAIGAVALLMWGVPKIIDAVKSVFGFGKDIDKELKSGAKQNEKDLTAVEDGVKKETDDVVSKAQQDQPDVKPVETPDPEAEKIPAQELNKGGEVKGTGDKDTVPAMLTPGEFVMSKGAVGTWGKDMLEGMNAAGGGSNSATMSGGKDGDGGPKGIMGGLSGAADWMTGGIKNMASGMFSGEGVMGFRGGGVVPGKDKTPDGSLKGDNKDMGNEPSAIAGIAEGIPYTYEQELRGVIRRHKQRTEDLNEAIESGKGVESTKRRHARLTRGLLKYKKDNPKVFAELSEDDKKYIDLLGKSDPLSTQTPTPGLGKSDPLPTQTPTPGKVGSGVPKSSSLGGRSGALKGGALKGGDFGGSSSTPANITAPSPVSNISPPTRPSSTVAYADQQEQVQNQPPTTPPSTSTLPEFSADAMISQSKIRVLGITI